MSYSSYDHDNLEPAETMKIERRIYFEDEKSDISGLAALPLAELLSLRAESAAAEQEVFDRLKELAAAWEAFSAAGGVDAVITHQPSRRIRVFLEGEAPVTPLDRLLERIEGSGGFSRWYFGQLHRDQRIPPRYQALFRTVAPLED